MWFLLFLFLFFCLLFWLPIRVEIDTAQQKYRVSWKGIFAVWGVPDEAGFHWFIRNIFLETAWKASEKTPKTVTKPLKREKKASKSSIRFSIYKIRPLFRAFSKAIHVERFRVNWIPAISCTMLGSILFFADGVGGNGSCSLIIGANKNWQSSCKPGLVYC